MKKQIKKRHRYILWALCCAFLLTMPKLTAQAATGKVLYGSTAYQWELDTTNSIGIYVNGDEAIADYEICLSYDSAMLRYVEGATEQQGNLLYIRGTGEKAEYKTMLHFETLQGGVTQLHIVSAVCHTIPQTMDVSENQGQQSEVQDFQMDLSAVAPINIAVPSSSRLLELTTEPHNLTDFSADVMEYTLEVSAEVEHLDVSYIPEDSQAIVTVSETDLEIGENTVTVTVESAAEERVYTIHVVRQTPVEETEEATEPIETTVEQVEETMEEMDPSGEQQTIEVVEEETDFTWDGEFIQDIVLLVGCILVAILAIVYFINNLKMRLWERDMQKQQRENFKVIDMDNTVINVCNVTMEFKMEKDEASSLKEYLIRALKKQNQYSYLRALNDVSFEVKQGEVVGIIGTNGSGKSTILKIVSGALKPTKGHVEVDRSKVQMLTLGTGFDMELTARENVYLNGSIIGYTREYIDEKFDDIVKFAELEGFMDERMKNFSSGMVSRLGFAIATMRDAPDILILDEVLSVGDMFFRQKSEKRIKEMIHSGATVLIVSHSMDTIKKNCNKVVWIEKGDLKMVGDPKTVCDAYSKLEKQ